MPSSKGYGGRIVERVLADEFGGSASIDYVPQGVVFTLDAPSKGLGVEPTEWSAP
ncbi:hypothetical protein VQ042_23860 [Aurantimonas sp. A2-1-M11]|uniref:hypothetical protein n=1 Tax=Aurantimonas sp. A2-1-M11 TaxID=3113712 RepID=UPI002F934255